MLVEAKANLGSFRTRSGVRGNSDIAGSLSLKPCEGKSSVKEVSD